MTGAEPGAFPPLVLSLPDWVAPVSVLVLLLVLAYVGMWRGWRRRARKHDLPPLTPTPDRGDLPPAKLEAGGRYFGTTVSGDWLDRVVARGLGARSMVRLRLSADGLDVLRVADSFRIPREALRGARHDQGIAGKVIPPHGVLVVTWQHGDLLLDSGFRLDTSGRKDTKATAAATPSTPRRASVSTSHDQWIRSISKLTRDDDRDENQDDKEHRA
jgi:hypothetical protein